jgi:high-affinity iron transporter
VVATFVIFLREGIEASLIAAILAAYLTKIGQRPAIKIVLAGMISAALLAGAAGVAIYATVRTWADTRAQTIFETVMYLLAAAILVSMSLWMGRHARSMSSELKTQAEGVLSKGERRGLFFLAFQATGRETIEATVFTLAVLFGPTGKGALLGGAVGLVVAAGIAIAMFKFGVKVNVSTFFKVIGWILTVFGGAMASNAVENLQGLGWLPFLDTPMWNSNSFIDGSSQLGDLLHAFIGYSAQPTPLQLLTFVGYIGTSLWLLSSQRKRLDRKVQAPAVA